MTVREPNKNVPISPFSFVKFFIVIILGSLYAATNLVAQDTFKHITNKDGLADNAIYHMIQDHLGYLWIATMSGVNRFDGLNFVHYTTKEGLGGNEILKMAIDSKNRIWFLSFNGVLSYYQDGNFYNPSNSELLSSLRLKSSFTNMLEDKKGNIWFTSEIGHLIQMHNNQVIFHDVTYSSKLNIRQIWENERGEILLGTLSGIYVLSADYQSLDKISNQSFWSIQSFELPNSNLLIPNLGGILHTEDPRTNIFDQELLGMDSNTTINNVLVTPYQEALIVGTLRRGVYLYTNSRTPTGGLYVNWLPNKSIASILTDSEGALWIATLDEGLFRFDEGYNAIKYLGQGDGIENSIIRSSLVTNDQTIWFGDQDGGIYRFNSEGVLLWKSTINQNRMGGDSIEAIYESIDGNILIGSTNRLLKINYHVLDRALKNGQNPHINDLRIGDNNVLGGIAVKAITGDENYIYVGSTTDLIEINLKDTSVSRVLARKRITSLEMDNEGVLWVGTIDGLRYWDGTKLKDPEIEFTEHVFIYDIDKLYGSWLAISTYGNGLILICTETNVVRQISMNNGLTSDLVRSSSLDENAILWVGTNSGLNRLELDTNKTLSEQLEQIPIISYTTSDGLTNEQITGIKSFNNQVWMSGTSGVTILRSPYLGFPPMRIPLIIENVSINNVPQSVQNMYEVSHKMNQWGIKVAGIFLRDAERLLYIYRIRGLNDEWIITNNNYIHIQYLPPGEYLFEIETFTADGRISSDLASIRIVIKSPFWLTSPFLILLAITILSMMYYVVTKRIAWVRNEERNILRVHQRLNELEHQAVQAMMKPHTVFNLINSIRFHLVKNEPDKASDLLVKIAKLIRLHLESSYKREIKLSEELNRIHLYVEIESQRLDNGIDFTIQIDNHINTDEVMVPSLILHPFIENAIIHGISPNNKRGILDIKIEPNQRSQLLITINDNGVGLRNMVEMETGSNTVLNGFSSTFNFDREIDNFYKSSLGLQLIMERMQLISRENGLEWFLTIKNKLDPNGITIGVTVTAVLPILAISTIYTEIDTVNVPN
jgi:ligand-binding sensor domain-containing protein